MLSAMNSHLLLQRQRELVQEAVPALSQRQEKMSDSPAPVANPQGRDGLATGLPAVRICYKTPPGRHWINGSRCNGILARLAGVCWCLLSPSLLRFTKGRETQKSHPLPAFVKKQNLLSAKTGPAPRLAGVSSPPVCVEASETGQGPVAGFPRLGASAGRLGRLAQKAEICSDSPTMSRAITASKSAGS